MVRSKNRSDLIQYKFSGARLYKATFSSSLYDFIMSEIRYSWSLYTAERVLSISTIYELEYVARLYSWSHSRGYIRFPNKEEWKRLREVQAAISLRRSQLPSRGNDAQSRSLQQYWDQLSTCPKEESTKFFASLKGRRGRIDRPPSLITDDDLDFGEDV